MLKVVYRFDWFGVKFKFIVVDIMYNRKYKYVIIDRLIIIIVNIIIVVIYGIGVMFVWLYIKKCLIFFLF